MTGYFKVKLPCLATQAVCMHISHTKNKPNKNIVIIKSAHMMEYTVAISAAKIREKKRERS